MRWKRWALVPLSAMVAAFLYGACSGGGGLRGNGDDPPDQVSPGDDGGHLPPEDAGFDGGVDGGADGGVDAGPTPVPLPTVTGWTFYGPQHGGPREVFGVSSDDSGNIWVAGGSDGLFLLQPGDTEFRRFTVADGLTGYIDPASPNVIQNQPVISVAGGPANTVFVGYKGVGTEEHDPVWMLKSGDADRVVWNGATLTVNHFDLSSPPGFYPQYPDGREKLRNVLRILYDRKTGDVWFGCDHGVSMVQAGGQIWEHQHVIMMGFAKSAAEAPGASAIEMTGDHWGIALDSGGNLWTGSAHRIAKLNYASEGRQFWASFHPPEGIDVWPDPVPTYGHPEERVDDDISDLVADSGGLWVASSENGLARLDNAGRISYVPGGALADPGGVRSLELDPKDGSLWIGHLWGGLTRMRGGAYIPYQTQFGKPLIDSEVWDIQSDTLAGQRRILVAFSGGVIGVYTGD